MIYGCRLFHFAFAWEMVASRQSSVAGAYHLYFNALLWFAEEHLSIYWALPVHHDRVDCCRFHLSLSFGFALPLNNIVLVAFDLNAA